ncbi:MAG: hypothetical protein JOZ29_15510 [Deltaproteobacteria bacterium]|nr:hypothetical protein [Deltaproteobacteria bacterium]
MKSDLPMDRESPAIFSETAEPDWQFSAHLHTTGWAICTKETHMKDGSTINHGNSLANRVIAVLERIIAERSILNGRLIQSDQTLVEIGLTSMDLARLVLLIEDEFDLRIPVRDLIPANFRSISTISDLISKLVPTI